MSAHLEERKLNIAPQITKISGEEAARIITQSKPSHSLPFDKDEAGRLGVRLHGSVSIVPDDNGKPVIFAHIFSSPEDDSYQQKIIRQSGL